MKHKIFKVHNEFGNDNCWWLIKQRKSFLFGLLKFWVNKGHLIMMSNII